MNGLVIKNTGSWYSVLTDEGNVVESKIKGNFRLKGIRSTNPVAVGDRVNITVNKEGTAFITEILDRRNYIIRKSTVSLLLQRPTEYLWYWCSTRPTFSMTTRDVIRR